LGYFAFRVILAPNVTVLLGFDLQPFDQLETQC